MSNSGFLIHYNLKDELIPSMVFVLPSNPEFFILCQVIPVSFVVVRLPRDIPGALSKFRAPRGFKGFFCGHNDPEVLNPQ